MIPGKKRVRMLCLIKEKTHNLHIGHTQRALETFPNISTIEPKLHIKKSQITD